MKRIALAIALTTASSIILSANEPAVVSDILKSTSLLMKDRKYDEAQKQILGQLKKHKTSHRLWLALGYVLEADGQFEKALKAFYEARNLKTGIEGLPERITRLENLLKSTKSDNPESPAAKLLAQAKYQIAMNNVRKGLMLFADAVLADRSLIGSEGKIVDLGKKHFNDNSIKHAEEDKLFFGGIFLFFAGNYDESGRFLQDYTNKFPEGEKIHIATNKLAEIESIKQQIAAARPDIKKPVVETTAKADLKGAERKDKLPEKTVKAEIVISRPASYTPTSKTDEYAGMSSQELYDEAIALMSARPAKAISLLSKSIESGGGSPELFMTLADLYSGRKGAEKEAIATYRIIMEKYPNTALAKEAKQKIINMQPSNLQRSKEVAEHFSKQ